MIFFDFNDIVDAKIGKGKKVNEVLLFESLKDSFGKAAFADLVHGNVGMVEFDIPSATPKKTAKCEAGDLLIVSFDRNEIRYTIMQNKTMHKISYYGTEPFTIPVKQHFVLSAKPIISPVGRSPYLFSTMFSDAILDSVGTFGVFYQRKFLWNTARRYFDMNYMIANRLAFSSPVTTAQFIMKSKRKAKFVGEINKLSTISSFQEVEACANLTDFEYALRKMWIGTPLPINNTSGNLLVKILIAKVSFDVESEDSQKAVKRHFLNVTSDFVGRFGDGEKEELGRIGMPTIVLIDNVDKEDIERDFFFFQDNFSIWNDLKF